MQVEASRRSGTVLHGREIHRGEIKLTLDVEAPETKTTSERDIAGLHIVCIRRHHDPADPIGATHLHHSSPEGITRPLRALRRT